MSANNITPEHSIWYKEVDIAIEVEYNLFSIWFLDLREFHSLNLHRFKISTLGSN